MSSQNTQDQRLATADETTTRGGIASPLHTLVMEDCVSYCYEKERVKLFTEDGVETLTAIRDKARELLQKAGAFSAGHAMENATGSSWTMLAALEYLVEKGEIVRVTDKDSTWGQHQIFTGPSRKP